MIGRQFLGLGLAVAGFLIGERAEAGLEICNGAHVTASVAIGYSADDEWTSEGWWVLSPDECKTVVAGDLPQRYYYWRATATAGPFDAERYMFCTHSRVFTIVGDENCGARGYEQAGFSKIDTGESRHYVFTIPASAAPGGAAEGPRDLLDELREAIVGHWVDTGNGAGANLIYSDGTIEQRWEDETLVVARWHITEYCPHDDRDGPWLLMTYPERPDLVTCWFLTGLSRSQLKYSVVGGGDFVMQKVN